MIKLNSVQAIIFDLDGTLVDSAEDLRSALNELLGEMGLRAIEPTEIKAMIGDGALKLIERGLIAAKGDPSQKQFLLPRFLEIYEANPTASTRCYSGVSETLEILQRRGLTLAVVTNKPNVAATRILQDLSIERYFSSVVGGDTLQHRKPHPAPLLEISRRLNIDPAHIVMVGDNIHDIEAARGARMRCVAVTYGYHHRPPAEFGADYVVDRFSDLLPIIVGSVLPLRV